MYFVLSRYRNNCVLAAFHDVSMFSFTLVMLGFQEALKYTVIRIDTFYSVLCFTCFSFYCFVQLLVNNHDQLIFLLRRVTYCNINRPYNLVHLIYSYIFWHTMYCLYHLTRLCSNFMASQLWLAVGPQIFIRGIIYKFSNVCPLDYTAFVVSAKVAISLTGLTTPVGQMSLLELLLSRSAIVV